MDLDTLAALCHSLAKAYSTGVRLNRGAEPLAYCSVYPLNPDPAGPHIPKMLECGAEVGIITTSAYQFYGFLTVAPELRVILGPTRALRGDGRELDGLMALLAVPPEEWTGYAQALRSAPVISVHRMAWLLCSLASVLAGHRSAGPPLLGGTGVAGHSGGGCPAVRTRQPHPSPPGGGGR